MLRFLVNEDGTLGEEVFPPQTETPPTADFRLLPRGGVELLRWPRWKRPSILPDRVAGQPLVRIAAMAFAAFHIPEAEFTSLFSSTVSFSVFCMRMGKKTVYETLEEGGPISVEMPDTVEEIGPYAFWRCRNLKGIQLSNGITLLPAGTFGDCLSLEKVTLPEKLENIGYFPKRTERAMPDTGAFAGCCSLKEIVLPETLKEIGAQTFNSSGLLTLTVIDESVDCWKRNIQIEPTAFDHTAKLLWMQKQNRAGEILYQIGLPVARDKILAEDARFGCIVRLPVLFFTKAPAELDQIAEDAFRLDFTGRMALSRLKYRGGLSKERSKWYLDLLVQFFCRAKQFLPPSENAYGILFDQLCNYPELTASHMSALIRTAGQMRLPAELLLRMMEVRISRFSGVTGFEDLELNI